MPPHDDDNTRPGSTEPPAGRPDAHDGSLGTIAAAIAHRVNNHLGGILITAQYAGAALERPDSRAAMRKALGDIEADVERCSDALDELLRVTRARGRTPTARELVELARAVVAERGGTVHVASSPGGGTIVTLELPRSLGLE